MTTVNTLVLTVTVLLTFALVATGAPTSASAQYLNSGDVDDWTGTPTLEEIIEIHGEFFVYGCCEKSPGMSIPSLVPFITLLIMGVVAGCIISVFLIKGRSGRHAAIRKG